MSRRRWTCETLERRYKNVSLIELRQRLAETLELLLSRKCQLQKTSAFSRDIALTREPRLALRKRKDTP